MNSFYVKNKLQKLVATILVFVFLISSMPLGVVVWGATNTPTGNVLTSGVQHERVSPLPTLEDGSAFYPAAAPGTIGIDKYIKDFDTATGEATIEMDVVGKHKQTTRSKDIVVVLDRSGSMSGDRWTHAKQAIIGMSNEVLVDGTLNRMALVTFSNDVYFHGLKDTSANAGLQYDMEDVWQTAGASGRDFFQTELNSTSPSGYTNIHGGLLAAEQIYFETDPTGVYAQNEPVVVLLSDGDPNYYYSEAGYPPIGIGYDGSHIGYPNTATDGAGIPQITQTTNQIESAGGTIYSINIVGADPVLMQDIATRPDCYTKIDKPEDIQGAVHTVTADILSSEPPMYNPVVTEVIGPEFGEVQAGSIVLTPNEGTAMVSPDGKTITWTLPQEPADNQMYTMTYKTKINDNVNMNHVATSTEGKLTYYEDSMATIQNTRTFRQPYVFKNALSIDKKFEGDIPTNTVTDFNIFIDADQDKILTIKESEGASDYILYSLDQQPETINISETAVPSPYGFSKITVDGAPYTGSASVPFKDTGTIQKMQIDVYNNIPGLGDRAFPIQKNIYVENSTGYTPSAADQFKFRLLDDAGATVADATISGDQFTLATGSSGGSFKLYEYQFLSEGVGSPWDWHGNSINDYLGETLTLVELEESVPNGWYYNYDKDNPSYNTAYKVHISDTRNITFSEFDQATNSTPVSVTEAIFTNYYIGNVPGEASFDLTKEFKGYDADLNQLSDDFQYKFTFDLYDGTELIDTEVMTTNGKDIKGYITGTQTPPLLHFTVPKKNLPTVDEFSKPYVIKETMSPTTPPEVLGWTLMPDLTVVMDYHGNVVSPSPIVGTNGYGKVLKPSIHFTKEARWSDKKPVPSETYSFTLDGTVAGQPFHKVIDTTTDALGIGSTTFTDIKFAIDTAIYQPNDVFATLTLEETTVPTMSNGTWVDNTQEFDIVIKGDGTVTYFDKENGGTSLGTSPTFKNVLVPNEGPVVTIRKEAYEGANPSNKVTKEFPFVIEVANASGVPVKVSSGVPYAYTLPAGFTGTVKVYEDLNWDYYVDNGDGTISHWTPDQSVYTLTYDRGGLQDVSKAPNATTSPTNIETSATINFTNTFVSFPKPSIDVEKYIYTEDSTSYTPSAADQFKFRLMDDAGATVADATISGDQFAPVSGPLKGTFTVYGYKFSSEGGGSPWDWHGNSINDYKGETLTLVELEESVPNGWYYNYNKANPSYNTAYKVHVSDTLDIAFSEFDQTTNSTPVSVPEAMFINYYIGNVPGEASFDLTKEFKGYDADLNQLSDDFQYEFTFDLYDGTELIDTEVMTTSGQAIKGYITGTQTPPLLQFTVPKKNLPTVDEFSKPYVIKETMSPTTPPEVLGWTLMPDLTVVMDYHGNVVSPSPIVGTNGYGKVLKPSIHFTKEARWSDKKPVPSETYSFTLDGTVAGQPFHKVIDTTTDALGIGSTTFTDIKFAIDTAIYQPNDVFATLTLEETTVPTMSNGTWVDNTQEFDIVIKGDGTVTYFDKENGGTSLGTSPTFKNVLVPNEGPVVTIRKEAYEGANPSNKVTKEFPFVIEVANTSGVSVKVSSGAPYAYTLPMGFTGTVKVYEDLNWDYYVDNGDGTISHWTPDQSVYTLTYDRGGLQDVSKAPNATTSPTNIETSATINFTNTFVSFPKPSIDVEKYIYTEDSTSYTPSAADQFKFRLMDDAGATVADATISGDQFAPVSGPFKGTFTVYGYKFSSEGGGSPWDWHGNSINDYKGETLTLVELEESVPNGWYYNYDKANPSYKAAYKVHVSDTLDIAFSEFDETTNSTPVSVPEAMFINYYIGNVPEEASFDLTKEFKGYDADLNQLSDDFQYEFTFDLYDGTELIDTEVMTTSGQAIKGYITGTQTPPLLQFTVPKKNLPTVDEFAKPYVIKETMSPTTPPEVLGWTLMPDVTVVMDYHGNVVSPSPIVGTNGYGKVLKPSIHFTKEARWSDKKPVPSETYSFTLDGTAAGQPFHQVVNTTTSALGIGSTTFTDIQFAIDTAIYQPNDVFATLTLEETTVPTMSNGTWVDNTQEFDIVIKGDGTVTYFDKENGGTSLDTSPTFKNVLVPKDGPVVTIRKEAYEGANPSNKVTKEFPFVIEGANTSGVSVKVSSGVPYAYTLPAGFTGTVKVYEDQKWETYVDNADGTISQWTPDQSVYTLTYDKGALQDVSKAPNATTSPTNIESSPILDFTNTFKSEPRPEINIEKSVNDSTIISRESAQYTLKVSSSSDKTLTNAYIQDSLLKDGKKVMVDGVETTVANGKIPLVDIVPGQTIIVTYGLTFSTVGSVVNTATVHGTHPKLGDVTDTAQATVKVEEPPFIVGGNEDNSTPAPVEVVVIEPDAPPLGAIDISEHKEYIYGYPDGTFKADENISRGEVAQIYYNLLEDKKTVPSSKQASFTDVSPDAWYADAVYTLSSMGILVGYPDGTFRPDEPITRAEFVTIASHFEYTTEDAPNFPDVSQTHWAYDEINSAAYYGWIVGYPDGSYLPEQNITRAEAITITNNMLDRVPDKKYIDSHDVNLFPDLNNKHWAFYNIMEASQVHDFEDIGDGEIWYSETNTSNRS